MSVSKKDIPVGIENFTELFQKNCYFVDKSGLIGALLKKRGWKVSLITRPRRFGKSLNMSMLETFFSPDSDKRVFNGLKILEEKAVCNSYMGKYPVISLSLKRMQGNSYEDAYANAVDMMNSIAEKVYEKVKDSECVLSEVEKLQQLRKSDMEEKTFSGSLCLLTRILEKYYSQKVIVLLDEYDVPLAKAYEGGYYDRMVHLIRNLLDHALKTNDSLEFAVLTGCMRVSKESIFTGLNNVRVRTISDSLFDEYFGFTDKEVQEMLDYYGFSDRYEKIRAWYDGYSFGNASVYCPWDVVNYCDKLLEDPEVEPESFWIHSSDNIVVRKLIELSNRSVVRNEIEALVNGRSIEKRLTQELTHKEMYSSAENLWSVLYMTGYLTKQRISPEGAYSLVIPNREILYIFENYISDYFKESVKKDGQTLDRLCGALYAGDPSGVERVFNGYLERTISLRDASGRSKRENMYHGILIGILGFKENWDVSSNREAGKGYSDIQILTAPGETAIVIEVKYADNDDMDSCCSKALEQIEKRQYAQSLYRNYSRVLKYGIACCRKECRVMMAE